MTCVADRLGSPVRPSPSLLAKLPTIGHYVAILAPRPAKRPVARALEGTSSISALGIRVAASTANAGPHCERRPRPRSARRRVWLHTPTWPMPAKSCQSTVLRSPKTSCAERGRSSYLLCPPSSLRVTDLLKLRVFFSPAPSSACTLRISPPTRPTRSRTSATATG